MTNESELLARLRAHPADDDARLVYADALVSRGDPRGEFIHVQRALDAMANGESDDAPEQLALERRELELLRTHEGTWRAAAGIHPHASITFARGMIETLVVRPEDFRGVHEPVESLILTRTPVDEIDSSDDLVRRATCLQRARIAGLRALAFEHRDGGPELGELRAFVAASEVSLLERFAIETPLRVEEMAAILELPALASLEVSGRRHGQTPPEVYEFMLEHPRVAQLRALRIDAWDPPNAFIERLADVAGRVEQLGLDGAAAHVTALAWPALKQLSLCRAQLARRWNPALADRIEDLALVASQLDDAWARAFIAQPKPRLRHLDLRANQLSAAGIQDVVDATDTLPALAELRITNQRSAGLGDALGRLASRPGFARLTGLDAGNLEVTSRALVELAASPFVSGLRSLALQSNSLDPGAFAALARSPGLRGLTSLDLSYTNLDPASFAMLCAAGNFPNLRRLAITGNQLGHEVLGAARALPRLAALELGYESPQLERELGVLTETGSGIPALRRGRAASLPPRWVSASPGRPGSTS